MTPKNHIGWFVIITRWGQWKKIAERLVALNVGHFIPRTYNTLVFLHTDKTRALNLVNSGEIKGRFLVDHGTRTLLDLLAMASKRSLEGMTVDVKLRLSLKGGKGTTLTFNGLDLAQFSE